MLEPVTSTAVCSGCQHDFPDLQHLWQHERNCSVLTDIQCAVRDFITLDVDISLDCCMGSDSLPSLSDVTSESATSSQLDQSAEPTPSALLELTSGPDPEPHSAVPTIPELIRTSLTVKAAAADTSPESAKSASRRLPRRQRKTKHFYKE